MVHYRSEEHRKQVERCENLVGQLESIKDKQTTACAKVINKASCLRIYDIQKQSMENTMINAGCNCEVFRFRIQNDMQTWTKEKIFETPEFQQYKQYCMNIPNPHGVPLTDTNFLNYIRTSRF